MEEIQIVIEKKTWCYPKWFHWIKSIKETLLWFIAIQPINYKDLKLDEFSLSIFEVAQCTASWTKTWHRLPKPPLINDLRYFSSFSIIINSGYHISNLHFGLFKMTCIELFIITYCLCRSPVEKFNIASNDHGRMHKCDFSVFNRKYFFWANLVKSKIKTVSVRWNLVHRLLRICRIQWW